MPSKVTYWTGVWDPGREAVSKDVAALRRALAPGSPVVSFSLGQGSSLDWGSRVVKMSGTRSMSLRMLAAIVEPRGDLTHAFGALDGWHFLRFLGRRPMLYTVAIPGRSLERRLYERVAMFAVESHALARQLRELGVPPDRIELVHPGVDLSVFSPAPPPPVTPFRLLFASTPADVRQFEARGVNLMIELARRHSDVQLVLLWRTWGNLDAAHRKLRELSPPPNVEVRFNDVDDMPVAYRGAHATVCCFAEGTGKSIPNSIIEGLACGRPALVTDGCGIADVIRDRAAGMVAKRSLEALSSALEALRADYALCAWNARRAAEELFDAELTRRKYADLYARLAPARN